MCLTSWKPLLHQNTPSVIFLHIFLNYSLRMPSETELLIHWKLLILYQNSTAYPLERYGSKTRKNHLLLIRFFRLLINIPSPGCAKISFQWYMGRCLLVLTVWGQKVETLLHTWGNPKLNALCYIYIYFKWHTHMLLVNLTQITNICQL